MVRDRRPLALQVRDEIRELIEREQLGPGDRLPTEAEIGDRFDVARTTVREALKLLEQDGVIDVRHGLGRFVSALPVLERPVTRLESVTEMMKSLGYEVSNRLLEIRCRPADEEEAAALGLRPGDDVIHLERLRLQGDEPLIYSVDILPRALVGGPIESGQWAGSLFALLEARGLRVVSATAEIKAVTLPPAVGAITGTGARAPWLLMVHSNLDESGRAIIYSHDYYRGDRFTFHVLRRRSD